MPDCVPFRLYVGEQVAAVIPILLNGLRHRGGTVTWTDQAGTFSLSLPIGGAITGSFAITGKSLTITITQRPMLVSCGTLESKLQDFILDAKAELKNHR
ncbi:hypothetical protein GC163_23465 [bacterium]|nr:hypothetical protein [bacterium]